MSNEKEKIAKGKIKPQSACKKWKSKKLGKNEYWTPTLLGAKKIETSEEEGDLSNEKCKNPHHRNGNSSGSFIAAVTDD